MNLAHGYVTPGLVWSAWNWEPAVIAVLVAGAAIYARGAVRLAGAARGRALPRRRWISFCVGVAVVAVALLSPMDGLGETLFSWHMGQHLCLMVVAPPLLVYGAPLRAGMMGLPPTPRRALHRMQLGRGWRRWGGAVRGPVVAWVVFAVVLWVWHLPAFYEAAVRHDAVHLIEHAAFIGAAFLFWSIVIQNTRRRRPGYGGAILFVFTSALQGAALGMVLLFSSEVLYPVHAPGARAWLIDPLIDQQVAGAMMWVPAGIVYSATIIVLFGRWLGDIEAGMRRKERRSAAIGEGT